MREREKERERERERERETERERDRERLLNISLITRKRGFFLLDKACVYSNVIIKNIQVDIIIDLYISLTTYIHH